MSRQFQLPKKIIGKYLEQQRTEVHMQNLEQICIYKNVSRPHFSWNLMSKVGGSTYDPNYSASIISFDSQSFEGSTYISVELIYNHANTVLELSLWSHNGSKSKIFLNRNWWNELATKMKPAPVHQLGCTMNICIQCRHIHMFVIPANACVKQSPSCWSVYGKGWHFARKNDTIG